MKLRKPYSCPRTLPKFSRSWPLRSSLGPSRNAPHHRFPAASQIFETPQSEQARTHSSRNSYRSLIGAKKLCEAKRTVQVCRGSIIHVGLLTDAFGFADLSSRQRSSTCFKPNVAKLEHLAPTFSPLAPLTIQISKRQFRGLFFMTKQPCLHGPCPPLFFIFSLAT